MFLVSIAAAMTFAAADSVVGDYTVRIVAGPELHAEVIARFPSADTVRMGTGAIDHIPRGWASFVENISAADSRGKRLAVTATQDTGKAPGWIISKGQGQTTLRYSVNLRFAKESWPPGNEQAGLWADSALFVVTKALFAAPDKKGSWKVTFDVPSTWRISSPWEPAGTRSFKVPNRESLLYNTVALGKHGEYRFQSDGFDITLALIGPASAGAPIVRETFEPVLREYLRVFESTPKGRYLMTIFYGDDEDGEGFQNSAAFRTKVPLIKETRLLWGNHLAHELVHMWLGKQLRGTNQAETEWFNEGFSEFLSNRSLLRTGMISREDFVRKMEYNISHYSYFRLSGIYDTVSVRESGKRKYRHRFGVYNGGWAVAFALDQAIDEKTQGRSGLDQVLKLMYQRRAVLDQPWTWPDLIQAATDVAGSDMGPFFTNYVAGLEPLPLDPALKRLGFLLVGQTYAAEMYVLPDPAATPEARARGQTYLRSTR